MSMINDSMTIKVPGSMLSVECRPDDWHGGDSGRMKLAVSTEGTGLPMKLNGEETWEFCFELIGHIEISDFFQSITALGKVYRAE